MSDIIIDRKEGLKLKNGKVIPFLICESTETGIELGCQVQRDEATKNKPFMFETPDQLAPLADLWASKGNYRLKSGKLATRQDIMEIIEEAFKKPTLDFKEDSLHIDHIVKVKNRNKVSMHIQKPKTQEEFLKMMEKNMEGNRGLILLDYSLETRHGDGQDNESKKNKC